MNGKTLSKKPATERKPAPPVQRGVVTSAPPTPSPARALQQRLGNQGTQALLQRKAAETESNKAVGSHLTESSEVVDISTGVFNPSEKVRAEIEAQGISGLMVRVVAKGLTGEGQVKIRADRSQQYDSIRNGSMPLLNPWTQQLGGMYLNVSVKKNTITGYASLRSGGGDRNDWLEAVKKNSHLLGGLGLKVQNLPKPENKFEEGKLTLGVTNLNVEVGGFLDAKFNILLENANHPKIDATANVNIKGVAKGTLTLDNAKEALAGEASLAIDFKAFSGMALVKYAADGTVDVSGKAAYSADKLSGEIEFVATDLDAANKFAKDSIAAAGGLKNVQDAPPPAPVPLPKPEKKSRALAATGQLNFNLTQWFAGTVYVVVDGNGKVTVIGKITPPGEILLFGPKPWEKELVKFEAKAYYGIPVVGNLNLFANISLHALATLGPAKLYKIEVLGTYSTDPEIQKNIQISGSINISAFAGLRLRAEGGAGIEILDHDLKFGIGLNADVGVKAYAEARPTFGFRDPSEFYISGTLEMVAQPMLGLGGEFFIKIETPWWSPLSDDKWTWPLFSKEWPLSDPIGINAVVKDYVLGSRTVPEIELRKPEFDPSKFFTSMVDNKLPNKSGAPGVGQGTFKDDGSVQKPVVPPKKSAPPKPPAKPAKKVAPSGGKSAKPDPKAQSDQAATKALKSGLDALKKNEPYSKTELTKALGALKTRVKGVSFNSRPQGDKWIITAGGGKKKSAGQQIELKMKKEGAISDEAQKAIAALDQVTERYAAKGATLEEMTGAIKSVRRKFNFKSLTVEQKGGFWYFNYELNSKGQRKAPKAVGKRGEPDERNEKQKIANLDKAIGEAEVLLADPQASRSKVEKGLKPILKKYRLTVLELVVDSKSGTKERVHVHGTINPDRNTKSKDWVVGMELVKVEFKIRIRKFNPVEYRGQLRQQERGINAMKMSQWNTKRQQFLQTKEDSDDGSGRSEASAADQRKFRAYIEAKITEVRARKSVARGIQADQALIEAKAYAATWMSTRAALHGPDQIAAGGRMASDAAAVGIDEASIRPFKQRTGLVAMGSDRINSSIGSQWGGRSQLIKIIDDVVRSKKYSAEDRGNFNMNVELNGREIP